MTRSIAFFSSSNVFRVSSFSLSVFLLAALAPSAAHAQMRGGGGGGTCPEYVLPGQPPCGGSGGPQPYQGGQLAFIPAVISTAAGNGTAGNSSTMLNTPSGIGYDLSGDLYVADTNNVQIRSLIAGASGLGTIGNGGSLSYGPLQSAVDASSNIWVNDGGANLVELSPPRCCTTGAPPPYNPYYPSFGYGNVTGLALDVSGDLYVSDTSNDVIWEYQPSISAAAVVAGNASGMPYSGEGGPATNANLASPNSVAVDANYNVYIADNCNIREVYFAGIIPSQSSPVSGNIYTIAGNGSCGAPILGIPALNSPLNTIQGITSDWAGNLYLTSGNSVLMISVATGTLTEFAGGSSTGYAGDGGPAQNALLGAPSGIAVDPAGNIGIADPLENVVRTVGPNGILTFGSASIGTTSPSQSILLTNRGFAPVQFSAAPVVTGDYSIVTGNTCGSNGSSIASGSSCTLNVTFHPSVAGTRSGTITLTANGDPNGSVSNASQIILTGSGTSGTNGSTLTLNGVSNATGTVVTLTATVTPTGGGSPPIPTGTIGFYNGTTLLYGPTPLNASRAATYTWTPPTSGNYSVTANYSGDSYYAPAGSTPYIQFATFINISVSPTTSYSGNPFSATAVVTTNSPTTPAGNVSCSIPSQTQTQQITPTTPGSAQAQITFNGAPVGTQVVTCNFAGDPLFAPSGPASATETVLQTIIPVTITLTGTPTTTTYGDIAVFTATVTPTITTSAVPTGTVTFNFGTTPLGTVGVSNGAASLSVASLPIGADSITATYSGDIQFQPGTSAAISETVTTSQSPACIP